MKEIMYGLGSAAGILALVNLAVVGITKSITVLASLIFLGFLLVVLWKS